MKKALHIFTLPNPKIFSDVEKWIHEKEGKILFKNLDKNFFICEADPIEMTFAEKLLVINNPHPDLLSAFFNLLEIKPQSKQLLIKSSSIISLMDFYQSLLTRHSWKACEIVSMDDYHYGLLVDGKEDFVILPDVDVQVFDAHQTIIYQ